MKLILTVLLGVILIQSKNVCSQTLTKLWTFETGDKVLASPVADENTVYIGGEDGIMYAMSVDNGEVQWQFDTKGIIQAQALLANEVLFFESANIFYALNKNTGKLIWKFDTKMEPLSFKYQDKTYKYKIDPWDDKRSAGVIDQGIIYVGSGNGTLYGFKASDGTLVKQFYSDDKSPIRSTPFVDDSKLYFGDWAGVVYAYDLNADNLLWKKKTYRYEKPYPSFGGISAAFVKYNDLLIFGARNHIMNVLFIETGEKEWTYIDPQGGWIVGDPVISNDTLYIGGSDNLSMYAFSPKWGRYLWQHNGGKNIYGRPALTDKYLIYSGGDGYNWKEKGVVFLLNRKDGKELYKFESPNATFSSPVIVGDKVIFGCYDGLIYGLKIE